jgi:hypothetical protein
MLSIRRLAKAAPALVLVALVLPGSAFGQATRTWVSGVGDDVNPCSRTAPCKTFAGAISKTAPAGEINCLDPGGFGALTINKALTIKCQYTEGGVLVGPTNGIVINAGVNDRVTLKGLDIFGGNASNLTALSGVKVLSARQVNIIDTEISRFQVGVDIIPTSAQTSTVIANSHIHDTGVGVRNVPGNNLITFTSAVLRNDNIQDNVCGVAVSSQGGIGTAVPNATDCDTNTTLSGINKLAIVDVFHTGLNFNGTGLLSRGSAATGEIAYDDITGNGNFGLHRLDAGTIRTFTPATNVVSNNAASDAPSTTAPLTKRFAKRLR